MADQPNLTEADAVNLAKFLKEASVIARGLKVRDDLLELAEIELQRSVATIARFQRACDLLLALAPDHPDAPAVIAEIEAADRASREPITRLYAITLLLPEDQGQALLDRHAAAVDGLSKSGRLTIV